MKIIADINGWRKGLDVNSRSLSRVTIIIFKPMTYLLPFDDKVSPDDIAGIQVDLYYHGTEVGGIPVFYYER
jgi:hypothetical protein